MDPKARFYRHFEAQATNLHEEIANLGNISSTGGEHKDATDHVLSAISRLTNEVSDASEFAPPRDQMIYNEVLKTLREQLNLQTTRLGPKGGFVFSPTSKAAFLASVSPTTRNNTNNANNNRRNSKTTDENQPLNQVESEDGLAPLPSFPKSKNYNAEMAARPGTGPSMIRKPSFSTARDIDIRSHTAMHILLPATAARATTAGRVADLHGCVLDMSVPTSTSTSSSKPHPFDSLMITDVSRSLVVAGHVHGPAHITGVRDSVLVVNARQVRMHECENVRVWLWCGSRPIVEDCKGVSFAEIPGRYLTESQDPAKNQWNQVDDFNWLKAEASPNWSTLSEQDKGWIEPQFWESTVRGGPLLGLNDILSQAGVPTS